MNNELDVNNKVFIQGVVDSIPEFDHTVKDDDFYKFNLKIARLSGQNDIIPVTIHKRMQQITNLELGQKISIKGQFRSYNKLENEKSRLILTVFAKEIGEYLEGKDNNIIELTGYICKPVVYRVTPLNREICDVLLAVNRSNNKSDYIPCIAWGGNAQMVGNLNVPEKLKIVGRIQSREYNKTIGLEVVTKRAYEVSIAKLVD